jgi:hypothetical protein
MTFSGKDLGMYQVRLKSDGTYQAKELPVGDLIVTIETESINPNKETPTYGGGKGKGAEMSSPTPGSAKKDQASDTGTYVKIPPKYKDTTTTDLKVTTANGSNTKDFELKD